MMLVSFATDAGSTVTPNEDAVAATPHVVAVVDGVSAPGGMDTGCVHGTPWYANSLASQITIWVARMPESDLQAVLYKALEAVAESHANTCDLTCEGTPSGTVAVLRERGDFLDYLVLSDAVIALQTNEGVQVIADKRVDQLIGDLAQEAKSAPVGSVEHEARLAKLVAEQRKLRNVEGGYWLAGAIPEAAHHAIVGSVNRTKVRRAAVMSDGAASLVDLYHALSWEDAVNDSISRSPLEWIRKVREIEATDPNGLRWPRYKRGDDATVVLCVP